MSGALAAPVTTISATSPCRTAEGVTVTFTAAPAGPIPTKTIKTATTLIRESMQRLYAEYVTPKPAANAQAGGDGRKPREETTRRCPKRRGAGDAPNPVRGVPGTRSLPPCNSVPKAETAKTLRPLLAEELLDLSNKVRRRRKLVASAWDRPRSRLLVFRLLALQRLHVFGDLGVLPHDLVEVALELPGGLDELREVRLRPQEREHPPDGRGPPLGSRRRRSADVAHRLVGGTPPRGKVVSTRRSPSAS